MPPVVPFCLSIVVIGASGDLAKKKTYPALLSLYAQNLLPSNVTLVGLARTEMTDASFRSSLKPYLLSSLPLVSVSSVDSFLSLCSYLPAPSYTSAPSYLLLSSRLRSFESSVLPPLPLHRLFYFAVPSSVFAPAAMAVKSAGLDTSRSDDSQGWTRLVLEKPLGRDLPSARELNGCLRALFEERQLYRIDHYLGKRLVRAILPLRFAGPSFLPPLWSNRHISSVTIVQKEPFGVSGRLSYFSEYGIVRDVIQNHLLQMLSLLAMERPGGGADAARDAKVELLSSVLPPSPLDVLLGQYSSYGSSVEGGVPSCASSVVGSNAPNAPPPTSLPRTPQCAASCPTAVGLACPSSSSPGRGSTSACARRPSSSRGGEEQTAAWRGGTSRN